MDERNSLKVNLEAFFYILLLLFSGLFFCSSIMKYHKIVHKNPNLDPSYPKTSSRLIIKPKNKAQITLSKDNTKLYFVT